MDPTIALENVRRHLQDLGQAVEDEDRYEIEENLGALQEAFSGLDNWLSTGGFLPGAWSRGENA